MDKKQQLEYMVEQYKAGKTVEEIALHLDTTPRSIIARVSAYGCYVKKVYKTKQGEEPRSKADMVEAIATLLDVNLDLLESMEKCNKSVLKLLENALTAK